MKNELDKKAHTRRFDGATGRSIRLVASFPHQIDKAGVPFNTHPHSLISVYVSPERTIKQWINLGFEVPMTSYGITQQNGYIFHTAKEQSGIPWLFAIDSSDLAVSERYRIDDIGDPHSVAVGGKDIFIVSTANDRIYSVPIDRPDKKPEVVYQAPGSTGFKDTVHLNSLLYRSDGQLLVSGFGPKPVGGMWKDAKNGFVVNINTGEELLSGLHQPHTLFETSNFGTVICESLGSRVVTLDGEDLVRMSYYTRGLAESDGSLLVGESTAKSHGRPGEIFNPGYFEGEVVGRTAIHTVDQANKTPHLLVDLNEVAPELYDIVALQ